jgi:hypothetical protein
MFLAQRTALQGIVNQRPTNVAGARGKLQVRAVLKKPQGPQQAKTCDIATIYELKNRCTGLNGDKMEACWLEGGYDVAEVTQQFAALVADIQRQHDTGIWAAGRLHAKNHFSNGAAQRQKPAALLNFKPARGHGRLHTKAHFTNAAPEPKQAAARLNFQSARGHGRLHTENHYQ